MALPRANPNPEDADLIRLYKERDMVRVKEATLVVGDSTSYIYKAISDGIIEKYGDKISLREYEEAQRAGKL